LALSRYADPFPTVALEAGIFGRPIICTTLGGLSEIVIDQTTGFHVPTHRPDTVAEAVKGSMARPDSVISMGLAAKKRVEHEFSSARFVGHFLDVIVGLATASSNAAGVYS
jgi:glycosyltransferase involved in cell wall biosynthesis